MKLRAVLATIVVLALGSTAVLASQGGPGKTEGRIGPATHIQPSGRKLEPAGSTTKLGNLPTGGALTNDGRFLWTLSAGRGANDIRIVRVLPDTKNCKRGKAGAKCRKKAKRKVGKVVQKIKMPGLSGGMAMDPTRNAAYVSGTPATDHADGAVPDSVPGKQGDVIHTFTYNPRTGKAKRGAVISVPPPVGTKPPQNFPPTNTTPYAWPRDLAVSPDGTQLLAALNLANQAAIVDLQTGHVAYTPVGRYPYGAAITKDGKTGLVTSETEGTVTAIDMTTGLPRGTVTVGPHLSHPESIAIDPRRPLAYVAVTNSDMIAVVNTDNLSVVRTLSVERPQGIGTSPVHVSVTADGCRLLSSDSGEDAIAVFALRTSPSCEPGSGGRSGAASAGGPDTLEKLAGQPVEKQSRQWQMIGRIPVASYPAAAFTTPQKPDARKLVWIAAKGLGVGRNDAQGRVLPEDSGSATSGAPPQYRFDYLPSIVTGMSGVLSYPSAQRIEQLTPKAARQIRPVNAQKPPKSTPLRPDGPIKHVFYVVRENRSYDQILGDDKRGDGDPKLTLFGKKYTPNAHALVRRFPLLDHVYANSEASIDGHFWASAGAVSDYVVKNWNANYASRGRPYDFGVYSVTWPSNGFLFDAAQNQGISYYNYGEAIAGTLPLGDIDRNAQESALVAEKFDHSDIGPLSKGPQLPPPAPCYSNDASIGKNVITGQDVFDSSLPPGVDPKTSESRFKCFSQRFDQQLAQNNVPAFNYMVLPSDHTEGTTPGRRTPQAMIADNDYALGQIVDKISHSKIWKSSLILVIEDDSQDGADHVDAHRIPALAISPYTKRGAVVHDRYDFLSFIRTLELVTGMKPLNLFDATAVPLYDAFDNSPGDNSQPYKAILPNVDRNARNPADAPDARLSSDLPLTLTDQVPQEVLDRILWHSVHGQDSAPPPPGPNASQDSGDEADAAELAQGLAELRDQLRGPYERKYGSAGD